MPFLNFDALKDAFADARENILLRAAHMPITCRRLSSGDFVPASLFAAGETIWLHPEMAAALRRPRTRLLVCRTRSEAEWRSGNPIPPEMIEATVTIDRDGPARIAAAWPGRFDVLLDVDGNGRFNVGDRIHGGSDGPAFEVVQPPLVRGSLRISTDTHTLPITLAGVPADVRVVIVRPTTPVVTPIPTLLLAHGGGYSPEHFDRLAEILATHGIATVMPDFVAGPLDFERRDIVIPEILRGAFRRSPALADLALESAVLLAHSVSATRIAEEAWAAEQAGAPFAGLIMVSTNTHPVPPWRRTPVLGAFGTEDSAGVRGPGGTILSGRSVEHAEGALGPSVAVVVGGGDHGDVTFPKGYGANLPWFTPANAPLREAMTAVTVAFCRRYLLQDAAMELFLDGTVSTVPSVGAPVETTLRVVRRAGIDATVTVDDAGAQPRPGVSRHGVEVDLALRFDACNCSAGRAIFHAPSATNPSARFQLAVGVLGSRQPRRLSFSAAQVLDDPGAIGAGLSGPSEVALDAGTLGTMDFVSSGLLDVSNTVEVIRPGGEWRVTASRGRRFRLVQNEERRTFLYNDAPLPREPLLVRVGLQDADGHRDHVSVRLPAAGFSWPTPGAIRFAAVSTWQSFSLPLAAFSINSSAITEISFETDGFRPLLLRGIEFVLA